MTKQEHLHLAAYWTALGIHWRARAHFRAASS